MKVGEFDGITVFVDEPYDEEDYFNEFNKKEILEYTSLEYPLDTSNLSKKKIYREKDEKRFIFKKSGKIVGSSDLYSIKKDHKATIRFWVAEDFQGQGIATNALKIILEYAFDKLNLVRVDAYVFKKNIGSQRTLEKLGFENEGLLKKFDKKGDEYIDEYIYSKIK